MGSVRLPGKVMLPLLNEPVFAQVLRRVRQTRGIDDVIAVVPGRDVGLQAVARDAGCRVYGGAEFDVLDRFFWASELFEADVIMRVTADCPLWDPEVGAVVLDTYRLGHSDYVSNVYDDHQGTTTDGLDVEVFSRRVLQEAWIHAKNPSEREHVTKFIRTNAAGWYRISTLMTGAHDGRWSLDTPEDFNFITEAYERLGPDFRFREVMAFQRTLDAEVA